MKNSVPYKNLDYTIPCHCITRHVRGTIRCSVITALLIILIFTILFTTQCPPITCDTILLGGQQHDTCIQGNIVRKQSKHCEWGDVWCHMNGWVVRYTARELVSYRDIECVSTPIKVEPCCDVYPRKWDDGGNDTLKNACLHTIDSSADRLGHIFVDVNPHNIFMQHGKATIIDVTILPKWASIEILRKGFGGGVRLNGFDNLYGHSADLVF